MHKEYYVSRLMVIYRGHEHEISSFHIHINIMSNIYIGLMYHENTTYMSYVKCHRYSHSDSGVCHP